MIVNINKRFVYVAFAKTASNSIERYLSKKVSGSEVINPHHRAKVPDHCRDFDIAVSVRNPYSRAVSNWWHISRVHEIRDILPVFKNMPFREFVELITSNRPPHPPEDFSEWKFHNDYLHQVARMKRNQSILLNLLHKAPTWIIRFENLEHDFRSLPFVPDHAVLEKTNVGNSGYGDWQGHYDEETAGMVVKWAAPDFDRLGYDTESWKAA